MAMTQLQDSDEWEEQTFETTPVLEHMRKQGMTLTRCGPRYESLSRAPFHPRGSARLPPRGVSRVHRLPV